MHILCVRVKKKGGKGGGGGGGGGVYLNRFVFLDLVLER